MQEIGFYKSYGYIEGIDVDRNNTFAYLATINEGLEIIDLEDKFNPYRIGNYMEDYNSFSQVRLLDNEKQVYLSSYQHLDIIDVSKPSDPVYVSSLDNVKKYYPPYSKFGAVIQNGIEEINVSVGEEGSLVLELKSNIDINLTVQVATVPDDIMAIDKQTTEMTLLSNTSKKMNIFYIVQDQPSETVMLTIKLFNNNITLEKRVRMLID